MDMPHWCVDETNALLYSIPFLGFIVTWLKSKISLWKNRSCKQLPKALKQPEELIK